MCGRDFGVVDTEKKTGQPRFTYATQIDAAVVEVDPETGEVEIVDYAAVDDCGVRNQPGDRRGLGARCELRDAIGAALHEDFVDDEEGMLATCELLRRESRAACDGHAPAEELARNWSFCRRAACWA